MNSKTGIVISGGAIRGIAHLGVMKALAEAGVKFDLIAGTSIGAIIGAFIAHGYEPKEIFEFYKTTNPFKHLRPKLPGQGLLSAGKLFDEFKQHFQVDTFEGLDIPLFVTTTNLTLGEKAVFHEGPLFPVLKAASAVPLVFNPVEIEGQLHADGGLMSNMPVEPLLGKCDYLIGINVNPIGEDHELSSMNDILLRTLHLSIWGNTNKNIEKLDVYIEPQELKGISLIDQSKMQEIFDAGYHSGQKSIENIHILE